MSNQTLWRRVRLSIVPVLVLAMLLVLGGAVAAATLSSGDVYHLPAGQVIEDNLYVTGGEIIIDGAIDGDLIAFGGYIEVNGEVSGDILAMGGAVVVNGPVAGDVRIAGGGLALNGPIGGDLVSAGGGAAVPGMPSIPITIGNRQVQQGTMLARTATVGRDAMMVGGSGILQGSIAGTLWAAMGSIQLEGTVGGDVNLYGNRIVVADNASIGGTLYYSTDSGVEPVIPSGVAASVECVISHQPAARPEPTIAERFVTWTISVVRALIGLLVLGWLLVRLAPVFTRRTLDAMNRRALAALGVGILVALVAVPVILVLIGLAWLFWGFVGGGLAVAFLLFGLLGVLWFVSPAITGLWLGRRILSPQTSDLLALVIGVLIVLLGIRVVEWAPLVGGFLAWLLLMASFAYAIGGILLGLRGEDVAPATPSAPTGPPL